ncbi:hypothetical protein JYK02_10845 [Corallococcus macrosporus]|uniref:Uncharacterized protein n=1 Tax=Corallococcus macrosporus TaxID=35 RepID=A0ABS3D8M3_9BACT|nr:hypothetical protein [Corallococcus macrosporus]MBN8228005.1 hypothetical protein [Corallococcus macrosporus]
MGTRYSPDTLNYFVVPSNENEHTHGRKRLIISFVVLGLLDYLAAFKRIDSQAVVTAEGSTIQAKTGGGVGKADKQWAHQVFRELSLNRVPLHLLENLEEEWMVSFLYCNSAVSKIPSIYNEVDGLIEAKIRVGFVTLATKVLREAPQVPFRSIRAQGQSQRRLIWLELLDLFITTCESASAETNKAPLKAILDRYADETRTYRREADLLAPLKSHNIYRKEPAEWNAMFAPQVRATVATTPAERLAKRRFLWARVQRDRLQDEQRVRSESVGGLLTLSQ